MPALRYSTFVKVGSFYPQRENFRLTAYVEEKFTEKLEPNPRLRLVKLNAAAKQWIFE
jgi:hypothetical protein